MANKVFVKFGTNKLRQIRDELESRGGSARKADIEKMGYNLKKLGIDHLVKPTGHIHHQDIHDHIEQLPAIEYDVTHGEWGSQGVGDEEEAEIVDSIEEDLSRDHSIEDFILNNYSSYDAAALGNKFSDRLMEIHDEDLHNKYDWTGENPDHDPDDEDSEEEINFSNHDEYSIQDHPDFEERSDDTIEDSFKEAVNNHDWHDHHSSLHDNYYEYLRDQAWEEYRNDPDYYQDQHGYGNNDSDDISDTSLDHAMGVSQQRHSPEISDVFQLNFNDNHTNKIKELGDDVYNTFNQVYANSKMHAHPDGPKGIGWVRYTQHPEDKGIHIDEIQSDVGQHILTEHARAKKPSTDREPKYNSEHLEKIYDVLFGGKHHGETLHESFLQHTRDTSDEMPEVAIWKPESKAPISGMSVPGKLGHGQSYTHYNHLPETEKQILKDHVLEGINNRYYGAYEDKHKAIKDFHENADQVTMNRIGKHFLTNKKTKNLVPNPENAMQFKSVKMLPQHMTMTYNNQPKDLGYKPSEYGKIKTQKNPRLEGEDTWQMKLRKKEILKQLLNPAIKYVCICESGELLEEIEKNAPAKHGEKHPFKPYVAKKHTTGELAWYHNNEQAAKVDDFIDKNRANFINQYDPKHHDAINQMIDQVSNSYTRHAVAGWDKRNDRTPVMRARHLKNLMEKKPGYSLVPRNDGGISVTAERHGHNYMPSTWTFMKKSAKVFREMTDKGNIVRGDHGTKLKKYSKTADNRRRMEQSKSMASERSLEHGSGNIHSRIEDLRYRRSLRKRERNYRLINALWDLTRLNKSTGMEYHPVTHGGPHFIFTAENPHHPVKINIDTDAIKNLLNSVGEAVEDTHSKFGGQLSRALIVHDPKNLKLLHKLSNGLGQASSIFSDGHKNEKHYYYGKNAGKYHEGMGVKVLNEKPEDNYLKITLPCGRSKFVCHNFNMDDNAMKERLHKSVGDKVLEVQGKLGDSREMSRYYEMIFHNTPELIKSRNIRTEGRVFVAMDGDNIGASVERAAMADDLDTIMSQSELIFSGQAVIRQWAKEHEGDIYIDGGDDIAFTLPAQFVSELDELRGKYNEVTNFTVTIGVGDTISHAGHSMLYGKLHGKNQVNIWSLQLEKELDAISRNLTVEEKMAGHGLLGKSESDIKLVLYSNDDNLTKNALNYGDSLKYDFFILSKCEPEKTLTELNSSRYVAEITDHSFFYNISSDDEDLMKKGGLEEVKKAGYFGFFNPSSPVYGVVGVFDQIELIKDDFFKLKKNDDDIVHVGMNTSKLREMRDFINDNGGVMHSNDLISAGKNPEAYGVNHLKNHEGKIKADAIDGHINQMPKMKFGVSQSTFAPTSAHDAFMDPSHPAHSAYKQMYAENPAFKDMMGGQHHSDEPSQVFQLNVHPEHIQKMKDEGVYDTFQNINKMSHDSNHPVKEGSGIGWLRYTHGNDGIHIDEVQSDLSQSFLRQTINQARMAKESGAINEEQAQQSIERAMEMFPEEHFEKIKEILFNKRKPTEIIHEGFMQHLRDNGHAGKDIHMWQAHPKAEMSGMDTSQRLPGHVLFTYDQMPKKAGYTPGTYGELETQTGAQDTPRPTWKKTLRKTSDWVDSLAGGLADSKRPEDFDPLQLEAGIQVESEHTNDKKLATEIAMDHLTEDPDYYKKLKIIEKSSKIFKPLKTSHIAMGKFANGPKQGNFKVSVHDHEGNKVGHSYFMNREDGITMHNTQIHPNHMHRQKEILTSMVNHAEKVSGKKRMTMKSIENMNHYDKIPMNIPGASGWSFDQKRIGDEYHANFNHNEHGSLAVKPIANQNQYAVFHNGKEMSRHDNIRSAGQQVVNYIKSLHSNLQIT